MVGQSQVTHPTASAIRELMLELCKSDKKVCVFLSGGVDSNSILAAYLANGIRPTALSFCLDRRPSTDFRCAQMTAKKEGLDFIPVFLPTGVEAILRDVRTLIAKYGLRRKAEIEAFWGCWYGIREAHANGIELIANGLGAGGLFGDDKEASIRGHGPDGNDPTWLEELRETKFAQPNYAQKLIWETVCAEYEIEVVSPYRDVRFREILKGHSYQSCNKVIQKQPIRDAFPEMSRWRVKKHTNLQLGDSGISNVFLQLLQHPINKNGYKSVVGIYNEVAREQA